MSEKTRTTAQVAALAGLAIARGAHAAGSDAIKFGLIGCGNRGTGAAKEALSTTQGAVQLVALGDVLAERLERSLANLTKYDDLRPKIDVPPERRFLGFDAYQKMLASGVDLVLLATPPHFRPIHYAAAVAAGKHVFMEKPCCIDAPGYRQLAAANEEAVRRKLTVVVGMQRRHQRNYREGIEKIRGGAIGQVRFIRTYFNMPSGGRSGNLKPAGMSEMEYQLRFWGMFRWLSGDHLVEQAAHEIDIANWVVGTHPAQANGMGGREVRKGPGCGDIWDHHAIEFEYADGVRYYCQARQQPGTWSYVGDHVHGTTGIMTLGTGAWGLGAVGPREIRAKTYRGDNPYQNEHEHLMASIRSSGPHCFEGVYGAESSMTAVLGRMASYSGQLITWDQAIQSEIHWAPKRYAMDADPPNLPDADGSYTAAVPGVFKF